MSSTTTTSTSSAISLFADLALKAKADLMDFGVRARSQLADLSRETGITAPDRATTLRGAELFFAGFGALSIATYLIPLTYQKLFHRPQNLVKKYNAKWALVTGGSSGIGLSIVERLATQNCNVVIVAYPDSAFVKNLAMLKSKYPHIQIRDVSVDLSKPGTYMAKIKEATADIDVQIIFNNAGYIKTGFFTDSSLDVQLGNHTCNATASLEVTHHFVSLLLQKKLRGCVGFTSSPAGFTPCPFSVVYGATKAFITEFAASIAPELKSDGIDVCVVHPSPVASRFYEGTHALGPLVFFKKTATGPETIAGVLFASMGRTVIRDQGYYPTMTKLILKALDFNLLTDVIAAFARFMPEFTTFRGVQPAPRAV